jgi:hypothetical protein
MGHSININNKTIMAKFILEVSDEYIRKQAEPERAAASIDDKTSGVDALSALFDVIAIKHVKDEIDKGTTEFNLSIDDMGDDKERYIFNSVVTRCGMLYVIKQVNEKKKQEEGKQE